MMASFSSDKLVDFGSLGPVGRSATEPRFFHFATVFGLIHNAWTAPPGSLDYFVLFDGLPPSLWRSREEPAPFGYCQRKPRAA